MRITDWTLDTVEVFAENTLSDFKDSNSTNQVVIADGVSSSPGYILQTRDLCGNLVTRGGLASNIVAKYVERTNETSRRLSAASVEDAAVTDNGDGTYTISLITTLVASFDLYVSFGTGNVTCDIFSNVQASGGDLVFNNVSGCFFDGVREAAASLPVPPPPTEAPTPALVLPPTEADEELLVIASSVGGTLGVLGVFAVFLAIVYRRRWRRDKEFIEEGALYRVDAMTKFDPNDKLSATGAQLMATRQAILRVRSQASNSQIASEMHSLHQEQEELMEQIRIAKQRIELAGGNSQPERPKHPREAIPRTKMEF